MNFASLAVSNQIDAPYSATVKASFEQKLPDGNAIRGFNVSHQARDSKGRTMNEMPEGCVRGEDGQLKERLGVNVSDPTTNTMMNWQVDDLMPKIVHVFHVPVQDCKQPTTDDAAEQKKRLQSVKRMQKVRNETRVENLGSKTVNGVLVDGTRTVQTISAGEEGNDLPLEVIREQWTSKELGLTLIHIDDDPRRGRTTIEFENLSRGEPDPAVFAAPAGYKIVEQHQEVEPAVAP
jgi:hypothetical protein